MWGDYLAVQNDYQRRSNVTRTSRRCSKYYQSIRNHYQKKSIDCPNAKKFTVKIPILTKQIIVMDTTTNYNENNVLQSKKRNE
jgi:hypothetical protein